MTAQEARLLSEKHKINLKTELERVYTAINTAVKKGEFTCSIDEPSIECRNELAKDGYTIICGFFEHDTVKLIIKW